MRNNVMMRMFLHGVTGYRTSYENAFIKKGVVRHTEINSVLHVMLRMELRNDLKDISGHKYDTIKDFNKLRIVLRQLEKNYKNPTKHITAKSVIALT